MSRLTRQGTNDPIESRRVDGSRCRLFLPWPADYNSRPEFKEACTKPACSGLSLDGTMETS